MFIRLHNILSKSVGFFTFLAFISSCAITIVPDENSPWYGTPVGSTVILRQDIMVPADRARVYIQQGNVVLSANPYETHCQFEVEDVFPFPQTIKTDKFTVNKVTRGIQNVVQTGVVKLASSDSNGGGNQETKMWYLWLSSENQTNVRRLSCGGYFETSAKSEYPSINEMRAALGEIVTLQLP